MVLIGSAPRRDRACAVGTRVEVVASVAAAERVWRALEERGVATPYQRYDWVHAFTTACPGEYRVAVVYDRARRPALLLPVVLSRRAGVTVAGPVGGKHANFVAPVMVPDWESRLDAPATLPAEVGAALGADALVLDRVPSTVSGVRNPLSSQAGSGAAETFGLPLGPDAGASLRRGLSGPARKKLRAKERHLADLGRVDVLSPVADESVEGVLEAFFRQKSRRFGRLGVADPFAAPAIRRFLQTAARARPGVARPPVEVHALLLDGRVVAVLGGASGGRRFSGMFMSFEGEDDAVLRCSPGEVLLGRVVAHLTERGFAYLDLGVGDAFYKRLFCSEVERVGTLGVAIGWRGEGVALAARVAAFAKGWVKRSPLAMRLLRRAHGGAKRRNGEADP